MKIRKARPDDAKAIKELHYASITELAADYYPSEIIEAWSKKPTPENIAQKERVIREGLDIVTYVAEINGKVVGFGEILPQQEDNVGAIYVHPKAARKGVGRVLMRAIEMHALENGITLLKMPSSLSAQRFYEAMGFESIKEDIHVMSSGQKMKCVRMQKKL